MAIIFDKMKAISIIFVLLFLNNSISAQQDPYIFSDQINKELTRDTSKYSYEKSAWNYSFIGEYQKALWAFDQSSRNFGELKEDEINYFRKFKPANARDFILKKAENEKIIIINEAHHQPMHRVFTTALLKGLYDKGYRFLGLEALGYMDSTLNERRYPILTSGYYTQEPQFGNMIREALKLGYYVFPYETAVQANGETREINQAKNIQKMIESHPEGKFLIHCGFGHIVETELPGWERAMAGRIKEYTGIDPLTVNQDYFTEHFLREKENPYFLLADTLVRSSVFVNGDEVFYGYKGQYQFDIRVLHPRTTYVNGRPSWLFLNGERSIYMVDPEKISIDYPVIIKAFLSNEDENAVPVDVIEVKNFSDQKALILPKGNYRIEIKNIKGENITFVVTVE